MKDLFVPYDIALKLKEIGFDEPCFAGYQLDRGENKLFFKSTKQTGISTIASTYGKYCHQNSHIVKAPLYQQVFEWFMTKGYYPVITLDKFISHFNGDYVVGFGNTMQSYRDSQILCINNIISLIKG